MRRAWLPCCPGRCRADIPGPVASLRDDVVPSIRPSVGVPHPHVVEQVLIGSGGGQGSGGEAVERRVGAGVVRGTGRVLGRGE